jgi:hypothetical protein
MKNIINTKNEKSFQNKKEFKRKKKVKKKKYMLDNASTSGPHLFIEGGRWVSPSPFPREAGRESLSTSDEGVGSNHGGWSSLLLYDIYIYIYCFRFL